MDESKKISRRQFIALGGQATIAAMLAACSAPAAQQPAPPVGATTAPASQQQPPTKAPINIEFLAWGDATDEPAWKKLVENYIAKNPGSKINVTAVADPNNNFYTKLQTMIAGGTPPHLSSFQGWEWQTYADKNLLQPIDDWIARDKFTAPFSANVNSVELSTKRKGKTYMIPMQLATMVMFYAKKIFDEAGVAYPKDDWTFDQFIETAKKLTKTSGADKRFGYQANGGWFRDIGWIAGTGKREFDNIVDPKKSQFNTPEIVKLVQVVAYDVYNTLKIAPTAADQQGGANTINTGNCALKYEGAWFLPQLNTPKLREEKKQVDFDVAAMPKVGDGPLPNRGWGEGIAIPKSDKAEQAWSFVMYAAGEEGVKIYSDITGRMPNTFDLIEKHWLPKLPDTYGVKNGKVFLDALKKSQVDVIGGVPRSKIWAETVKPTGWDPMIAGKLKADEALKQVDEKLQKVLDDYWKTQ
jgi:multiple sugar transport system substrate-binding protein